MKYWNLSKLALRQAVAARGGLVGRLLFYWALMLIFGQLWVAVGTGDAAGYVWYLAITELVALGVPQIYIGIEQDVRRARGLLQDASDLMSDLSDLRDLKSGVLRIGVSPVAFSAFLENTVSAFARVYPGVGVHIETGTLETMVRSLLAGEVDLLIGGTNYLQRWQELDVVFSTTLHCSFISRSEHPLCHLDTVTAADMLGYPVVMPAAGVVTEAQLADAYTRAGLSPMPPQYTCDHFPLVRRIVAATDAIAPMVSLEALRERPDFHVFGNVVELDEHTLGVASVARRPLSPAATAFADLFAGFLSDARD